MIISSLRRLVFCSKSNINFIDVYLYNFLKRNVSEYRNPSTRLGFRINVSRSFCTNHPPFEDVDSECEHEVIVPLYQKPSKKEAVHRFVNCLGYSESEATNILKDFPKLKNLATEDIQNKILFFNNMGIETKEIFKNPWMLSLNPTLIESKFNYIKTMGITNLSLAIPLLEVTPKRLEEIKTWSEIGITYNKKTRIAYISEKLECDPAEITCAISVHQFIDRMEFDRLLGIIEILLDAGVFSEDILRDIWVVRYNKEQVSERISRAKEGGIEQFKPWMVRCTEKVFNNTLRRHSEKRVLLGPHKDSAIQYISSRLGVNNSEAGLILTRHPQLRGVGAAKLCNTLDFLLGKEQKTSNADEMERTLKERGHLDKSAKFNRAQVWNSIRALCHSLDTMKVRLSRLRALGYEPYSPSILYMSRKKFEKFVKKLEEKAEQSQSEDSAEEFGKEKNKKGLENRNGPTG